MRKFLIFFICFIGVFSVCWFNFRISQPEQYQVKDGKVYFWGKEIIPNADPNSFEPINYQYAKDKNSVFRLEDGKFTSIAEADPISFQVLEKTGTLNDFTRDKNHLYYRGIRIQGVDPDSFKQIKDITFLSGNSVYKGINKILQGVDFTSFEFIPGKERSRYEMAHYRDKNNLYRYENGILQKVTNTSLQFLRKVGAFEVYEDGVKIPEVAYGGGRLLPVDPDSFKYLSNSNGRGYYKDKDKVYFYGNYNPHSSWELHHLDDGHSASFSVIPDYSDLARDWRHIFHKGKVVPEMDSYKLQRVMMSDCHFVYDKQLYYAPDYYNISWDFSKAKMIYSNPDINSLHKTTETACIVADNKNIYYRGKVIENPDFNSFQIFSDRMSNVMSDYYKYYSKDKDRVWYDGLPIAKADSETFTVQISYAKDKNNLWYGRNKIEEADVSTFQQRDDYDALFEDSEAFYYRGKRYKKRDNSELKKSLIGVWQTEADVPYEREKEMALSHFQYILGNWRLKDGLIVFPKVLTESQMLCANVCPKARKLDQVFLVEYLTSDSLMLRKIYYTGVPTRLRGISGAYPDTLEYRLK